VEMNQTSFYDRMLIDDWTRILYLYNLLASIPKPSKSVIHCVRRACRITANTTREILSQYRPCAPVNSVSKDQRCGIYQGDQSINILSTKHLSTY
jgi:hypothetical protein